MSTRTGDTLPKAGTPVRIAIGHEFERKEPTVVKEADNVIESFPSVNDKGSIQYESERDLA